MLLFVFNQLLACITITITSGGLHNNGFWPADEEVQFSEGGKSQVCPEQDLDALQNPSVGQTGEAFVIIVLTIGNVIIAFIVIKRNDKANVVFTSVLVNCP